jgi:hypothetical protein
MRQYPAGESIRVQADRTGRPLAFVCQGHPHRIESVEEAREPRLDWWSPGGEIHRTYYLVSTDRGMICEIYRDMTTDDWFLARVYD